MKRYQLPLTSALFFLILSAAMRNNIQAQPLQFGIQGGINFSSHLSRYLEIDDDFALRRESTAAPNYQVGLILSKTLSPIVRLQLEPTLIRMGAFYHEGTTPRQFNLTSSTRTELLYLQFPLLVQFSTVPREGRVYGLEEPHTTYHLTAGFYGSNLLNARYRGVMFQRAENEDEFTDSLNSFYPDYEGGAVFGLGIEHGRQQKIGFETRAILSFMNSKQNSDTPKNIGLTFSVYYLL